MDSIEGALSLIPRPLKFLLFGVLNIGYVLFVVLWYICMIPVAIIGWLEIARRKLLE